MRAIVNICYMAGKERKEVCLGCDVRRACGQGRAEVGNLRCERFMSI